MKNIIQLTSVMAVSLAMSQALLATPINGTIGFTGGVTYDTSSAATATEVTSWITPIVKLDSGSFATIATGSAATFTSSVWSFNTSTPMNNFWSVGGFTFRLLSSSVSSQGGTPGQSGYIFAYGTGIVSGNGYDNTFLSWSFTSQDPKAGINPDSWTFSASAAPVPDGGTTVVLLGMALSCAALLKRQLTA